jgi:hypothetical protein
LQITAEVKIFKEIFRGGLKKTIFSRGFAGNRGNMPKKRAAETGTRLD